MTLSEFDIVVENGTILTMDAKHTTIEDGQLGLSGDTIAYVGPAGAMEVHGTKVIDAGGGIVMPGLVNGHTHAAMTLFRGLADDMPLMEWLNSYIFPVEKRMDASFVYTGTLLACAEMILGGTTTFCDMYLFEEAVAQAAKEAGLRAVVGEVIYDFPSPNYGPVEEGLKYTEDLIEKWRDDPLITIAVEPHSPYVCSPELLQKARAIANFFLTRINTVIIIVAVETACSNCVKTVSINVSEIRFIAVLVYTVVWDFSCTRIDSPIRVITIALVFRITVIIIIVVFRHYQFFNTKLDF